MSAYGISSSSFSSEADVSSLRNLIVSFCRGRFTFVGESYRLSLLRTMYIH